ncbi:helix-turn-helix domain-containing protein [Paenibacillus luteus]|uniref:helix-turn-helix domain-containing protein n=1 Tax=Paenibacillus luteus TaxID=2545753 RepID=UPI0011434008|nr:helix-turn-helix domain-containing protein [Paenibacillus luteus]
MSIYEQVFQMMDQPMLILIQDDNGVRIEDANQAFIRMTGYTINELQSEKGSIFLEEYKIETSVPVLKSEVSILTKQKKMLPVRLDQQPLPKCSVNSYKKSFVIFEDLTPYKWIEQQSEKNKVLISGIVDRHEHIRFLRDSLGHSLFEAQQMNDESLLQFVADTEQGPMRQVLQKAKLDKEERSLTIRTSKLSGIELNMSVTFAPILDGFGDVREFAFVIWDLNPIDDQVDASLKLRIWMAKKDMSAGHLSALTGISIQTISKLRNGKILKPQRLTAELIASELQVDVYEIWQEIRK